MAKKQGFVPNALRPWIEARQRFHLTDAQVQMARELGLNPNKLGKIANHRQEPWKAPLPVFIEHLYVKRFGKPRPDITGSLEEVAAARRAKKAAKKEARNACREAAANGPSPESTGATDDADDGILDGTAIERLDGGSGRLDSASLDLDSGSRAMRKPPTRVKWHDLGSAFQYVSSGLESEAVLNRETGEFFWRSEDGDDLGEWPDDVDDGEKYLPVPGKRDLDLGQPLVMNFTREFLPDDFDDVRRAFSRRGAYPKFRELVRQRDVLEQWYEFENGATERALRRWCEENDVVIVTEDGTAGDGVE